MYCGISALCEDLGVCFWIFQVTPTAKLLSILTPLSCFSHNNKCGWTCAKPHEELRVSSRQSVRFQMCVALMAIIYSLMFLLFSSWDRDERYLVQLAETCNPRIQAAKWPPDRNSVEHISWQDEASLSAVLQLHVVMKEDEWVFRIIRGCGAKTRKVPADVPVRR